MDKKALLTLSDGSRYEGKGFGACTSKTGELVFNTSMQGYQEALTDPSYAGQMLTMSYPLIGNYGINDEDFESSRAWVEGFVVREASKHCFHRNAAKSLDKFLSEQGVPGISGIDTRELVKRIRNHGVVPSSLTVCEGECAEAPDFSFDYSSINFVEKVSCKKPEEYPVEGAKKKVALLDLGVKRNIIRELNARKVSVITVPWNSTEEQIRSCGPDGILLSNGPGDPALLTGTHSLIRSLSDLPIFGICLGHQCLAHAFGGNTKKLKFGHRGSNHPVYDKERKKVLITTQNHGFAVDRMPEDFALTQIELNDKTVEGMRHKSKPIFSVQYHPEASPGPHDAASLFDEFKNLL